MLRSWLHRLRPPRLEIDPLRWDNVMMRLPWTAGMSAQRLQVLRLLGARFLQDKIITPLAGLQLDDDERMLLAGLCCLPLLEFGMEGLHGWSQLLVYPDAFRAQRSHVDAAGVMHQWDDELIGEAWEQGPLILSWADVLADIAEPDAGFCVAIHEMAHKLDALDGVLDGTPALPREWQRQWAKDFQRSFDRFGEEVEAGIDNGIDPYAAYSPEEFFAVVSEYHFSAPSALRAGMPEVAGHLLRFYGPSPPLAATRVVTARQD